MMELIQEEVHYCYTANDMTEGNGCDYYLKTTQLWSSERSLLCSIVYNHSYVTSLLMRVTWGRKESSFLQKQALFPKNNSKPLQALP